MSDEIAKTANVAKEAAYKLSFTDEQKETLVHIVDALLPDIKKG